MTTEEEDQIKREAAKAEAAKEIQNNTLDVLKARAEDTRSEFAEARDHFQKTAAKGGT